VTENQAEYYVSKAPAPLRGLDYARKRILNWFRDLSLEGRCYAIGLGMLALGLVVSLFERPEAAALSQFGALVFACGLLPLIEWLYEWAWRKLLGKLIIAALIALATNMAYGFGRQMVAELIGTNPEPFAATVNIATILLSPVLILMALAIGGFFIFIIALYVGMLASMAFLASQPAGKGKHACLWLCRFVALAIAVFGSWGVLNHSAGYNAWVSRRAASYLYTFDMYHDAQYAQGKEEKIVFLPDGRILIGSPRKDGGYIFEPRRLPDVHKTKE
jgi:hypothetical protein